MYIFGNWCKYREQKIELPFLKAIFELWKNGNWVRTVNAYHPRKNIIEVVENAFNEGVSGKYLSE